MGVPCFLILKADVPSSLALIRATADLELVDIVVGTIDPESAEYRRCH